MSFAKSANKQIMRKPQMKKQEFKSLIDKEAKLCGSQNALARRLGVSQGSMSEYGSGKRSVPDEVIRRLAEISGENPADLWVMAQDARNPFRQEAEAEARNYEASAPSVRGRVVSRALVYGRKILQSIILDAWLRNNV